MKVNFLSCTNKPRSTFRGCSREYMDNTLKFRNDTGGRISTYTCAFRPDIDWKDLIKTAEKEFKDFNKINLYSLACSDGSEAYSLLISINENSENPKKYFPVIAVDKDEKIIDFAKKHRINFTRDELARIIANSKSHKDYFTHKGNAVSIDGEAFTDIYENSKNIPCKNSYKPTKKLRKNVRFKQEDIIETLNKIKDKGNSIILCRNVFPYLPPEDHLKIYELITEKLKSGSLFIVGQYDFKTLFYQKMEKNGFKQLGKFIFKKI